MNFYFNKFRASFKYLVCMQFFSTCTIVGEKPIKVEVLLIRDAVKTMHRL